MYLDPETTNRKEHTILLNQLPILKGSLRVQAYYLFCGIFFGHQILRQTHIPTILHQKLANGVPKNSDSGLQMMVCGVPCFFVAEGERSRYLDVGFAKIVSGKRHSGEG